MKDITRKIGAFAYIECSALTNFNIQKGTPLPPLSTLPISPFISSFLISFMFFLNIFVNIFFNIFSVMEVITEAALSHIRPPSTPRSIFNTLINKFKTAFEREAKPG